MKTGTLSLLLLAAAALAGTASAQAAYAPPAAPASSGAPAYIAPYIDSTPDSGWNGDTPNTADAGAGKPMFAAFNALKIGNFARAEEIFTDFVRRNPRDPEGALYLGATRMELGKWSDAKALLEVAAQRLPRHPDPKSRLGVTYARLGDTAGANAQRAELVKMATACNNACKLAPYIKDGIQMIDDALALGQAQG